VRALSSWHVMSCRIVISDSALRSTLRSDAAAFGETGHAPVWADVFSAVGVLRWSIVRRGGTHGGEGGAPRATPIAGLAGVAPVALTSAIQEN
jgi:hypothetical protein